MRWDRSYIPAHVEWRCFYPNCTPTGEAAARRVALGAVRQALSRVNDLPPLARLGLHTGFSGIALAAARLGVVLGEQELLHRSANLLKSPWLETKTSASLT